MINLNFVNKVPKIAKDNEIILLTQKIKKSKEIEELTKSVFSNKLFLEQNFLTKDYNNKSYILVNCTKSKVSLDFEKLGSKLFVFLKENKKENSFIKVENNSFTNAQLEKFLHGARLKSYNFNLYKTDKKKDININLSVVGSNVKQKNLLRNKLNALLEGVFLTRDLVSEPGNILHPDEYAKRIVKLRKFGLKVTVYDQKRLKKLGFNALLGVGQGSIRGSYMVTIEWNGNKNKSKPLAFVGKGVCFDTGGISLKPAKFMEDMTYDMAGSATVVGLMKTLALRKSKINAVGVVGLVENMPGANAQRPGDIVKSYSGQTIEVLNTDAEGRLTLADAVEYAKQNGAKQIIDIATLTGAMVTALGHGLIGTFGNNNDLLETLKESGEETGEKIWFMPLDETSKKQNRSKVADIKNTGGRPAGSVTAAHFIGEFVGDTPWVHLDIAGTAMSSSSKGWIPQGATGFPCRTLIETVLRLQN